MSQSPGHIIPWQSPGTHKHDQKLNRKKQTEHFSFCAAAVENKIKDKNKKSVLALCSSDWQIKESRSFLTDLDTAGNELAANTYCSSGLCRCPGLFWFWVYSSPEELHASAAHSQSSSDMTAARPARAILWDLSSFNSSTAESVIFRVCCRHVMFRMTGGGRGGCWVREGFPLAVVWLPLGHISDVLYIAKNNDTDLRTEP